MGRERLDSFQRSACVWAEVHHEIDESFSWTCLWDYSRQPLKIFFFHTTLIICVVAYTVFGAFVFQAIEGNHEKTKAIEKMMTVNKTMAKLHEEISKFSGQVAFLVSQEDISRNILKLIAKHKDDITSIGDDFKVGTSGKFQKIQIKSKKDIKLEKWTYSSSVLFAFTTITTIGYGHVYLETDEGRIFCIFYALIGIPLTMIIIADIGKFFLDFCAFLANGVNLCIRRALLPPGFELEKNKEEDHEFGAGSVLIAIFFSYVLFGSVLFPLWEGWEVLDGIYFGVTTLTTIGFGDIYPANFSLLVPSLFWIFVGLGLTVSAIESMSSLFKKIHFLGKGVANIKDMVIWFGNLSFKTGDLVAGVGASWGVPEDEIENLNLDKLVDDMAAGIEISKPEPEIVIEPGIERDNEISQKQGIQYPSDEEIQHIHTPNLSPTFSQPFHNVYDFVMVNTKLTKKAFPRLTARCKTCNIAFPAALSSKTTGNEFQRFCLVHWERYTMWGAGGAKKGPDGKKGAPSYSKETDLKPVLLHPWYQCVLKRYPYVSIDKIKIDVEIKQVEEEEHDPKLKQLMLEQFGIENIYDCEEFELWTDNPANPGGKTTDEAKKEKGKAKEKPSKLKEKKEKEKASDK